MSLVPAKCTNCGANIKVDPQKEAGICESCGTPFITEKVINNYNVSIQNTTNINGENVNVFVDDGPNIHNLIKRVYSLLEEKDFEKAKTVIDKILEKDPENGEAYFLMFLAKQEITSPTRFVKFAVDYSENVNLCSAKKFAKSPFKEQLDEYVRIQEDAKDIYTFTFAEKSYVIGLAATYLSIESSGNERKIQYKDITKIVVKRNSSSFSVDIHTSVLSETFSVEEKDEATLNRVLYGLSISIKDFDRIFVLERKEGCYVATCVYGSYDCPQVWTLRRYRDDKLAKTWLGRAFIRTYYAISPTLVKWFGKTKWFKRLWKGKLDKMVSKLQKQGFKDTPYEDKNW